MTIEIDNLSKVFGEQRAVDSISFNVDKGQILGFLGPNGAGKSTTMKMITSYLTPTEGNIRVLGKDTQKETLETRKHIGYLPEHNPLYLDMYVKEYLQFVCEIHKISNKKKRSNELIEMVGLEIEQHKKIGTLSKGYRQRVGLAQALIHDPEILILDEPTSGLDMNQLQDIRRLIRNLGKEKTVIFSTHIMQEVNALCDRVVIINQGKLVIDESIDLLASKVQGQTEILLEVDQKSPINFTEISGVSQAELKNGIYHIYYPNNQELRKEIFQLCVSKNAPILSMQQVNIDVENVFQKLTN